MLGILSILYKDRVTIILYYLTPQVLSKAQGYTQKNTVYTQLTHTQNTYTCPNMYIHTYTYIFL